MVLLSMNCSDMQPHTADSMANALYFFRSFSGSVSANVFDMFSYLRRLSELNITMPKEKCRCIVKRRQ